MAEILAPRKGRGAPPAAPSDRAARATSAGTVAGARCEGDRRAVRTPPLPAPGRGFPAPSRKSVARRSTVTWVVAAAAADTSSSWEARSSSPRTVRTVSSPSIRHSTTQWELANWSWGIEGVVTMAPTGSLLSRTAGAWRHGEHYFANTTSLRRADPDGQHRIAGARAGKGAGVLDARNGPKSVGSDVVEDAEMLEAAADAGLRYVVDVEPGIRRRRRGRGFSYTAAAGRPRGCCGPGADRRPRHSSGLDRCLDLRGSAGSPAGDGQGRPRPQAVPVPPTLERGARRREVRPPRRLRRSAAGAPLDAERRSLPAGPAAAQGRGARGRAARPHAHPGRQRRVPPPERQLRVDDARVRPRRGHRRDHRVLLQREGRA